MQKLAAKLKAMVDRVHRLEQENRLLRENMELQSPAAEDGSVICAASTSVQNIHTVLDIRNSGTEGTGSPEVLGMALAHAPHTQLLVNQQDSAPRCNSQEACQVEGITKEPGAAESRQVEGAHNASSASSSSTRQWMDRGIQVPYQ